MTARVGDGGAVKLQPVRLGRFLGGPLAADVLQLQHPGHQVLPGGLGRPLGRR